MSLNKSEKEWLSQVYDTVCARKSDGRPCLSLADLGNTCILSKSQKSKCRKLSVLINLDDRFRITEDGNVEVTGDANTDTINNFFRYMCTLSEEELILCEDRGHLEHHFSVWADKEQVQIHGSISQHVSMVVDDLIVENKVAFHHDTNRIVFETFEGRILSRLRDIETHHLSPLPGDGCGMSILSGTDWSNCHFNDQTEFEKNMFKDIGSCHRYEVRSESFLYDRAKRYTGVCAL